MKNSLKKNLITTIVIMSVLAIVSIFASLINFYLVKGLNSLKILVSNNGAIVHFIDVGQGDAIAINLPDDKIMIIDCGPQSSSINFTDYLSQNVFNNQFDKDIDFLLLTHFDADHIGGAVRLIENFNVKNVFVPTISEPTISATELQDKIKSYNINSIDSCDGITLEGKEYKITFYGPLNFNDENDNCPVVKFVYNNYSFLFTGDISSVAERALITQFGNELDCDVLKVAHHGGRTSSCLEFLQITSPKYAVISCGYNNYGHPTEEVIDNIKEVNATEMRTDILGNIAFYMNAGDLQILNGNFYVTNMNLDIRYFILIIDGILVISLVIKTVKFFKDDKTKFL